MSSPDYGTLPDQDLHTIRDRARRITLGWQAQHVALARQAEDAEYQARVAEQDLLNILEEIGRRETPTTDEMEDA